jgi:hypothetical protein
MNSSPSEVHKNGKYFIEMELKFLTTKYAHFLTRERSQTMFTRQGRYVILIRTKKIKTKLILLVL